MKTVFLRPNLSGNHATERAPGIAPPVKEDTIPAGLRGGGRAHVCLEVWLDDRGRDDTAVIAKEEASELN